MHLCLPCMQYMDKADFGQAEDWCPHYAPELNMTNNTNCVVPTIAQLLMMSSGLIDADNCAYPPTAWQNKYCVDLNEVGWRGGGLGG